jgi:hypothetical protein
VCGGGGADVLSREAGAARRSSQPARTHPPTHARRSPHLLLLVHKLRVEGARKVVSKVVARARLAAGGVVAVVAAVAVCQQQRDKSRRGWRWAEAERLACCQQAHTLPPAPTFMIDRGTTCSARLSPIMASIVYVTLAPANDSSLLLRPAMTGMAPCCWQRRDHRGRGGGCGCW